jgi:hypothetical protein
VNAKLQHRIRISPQVPAKIAIRTLQDDMIINGMRRSILARKRHEKPSDARRRVASMERVKPYHDNLKYMVRSFLWEKTLPNLIDYEHMLSLYGRQFPDKVRMTLSENERSFEPPYKPEPKKIERPKPIRGNLPQRTYRRVKTFTI